MSKEQCPICFVDLADDGSILTLPCSIHHKFHEGCITELFNKGHFQCPLCRIPFPNYYISNFLPPHCGVPSILPKMVPPLEGHNVGQSLMSSSTNALGQVLWDSGVLNRNYLASILNSSEMEILQGSGDPTIGDGLFRVFDLKEQAVIQTEAQWNSLSIDDQIAHIRNYLFRMERLDEILEDKIALSRIAEVRICDDINRVRRVFHEQMSFFMEKINTNFTVRVEGEVLVVKPRQCTIMGGSTRRHFGRKSKIRRSKYKKTKKYRRGRQPK